MKDRKEMLEVIRKKIEVCTDNELFNLAVSAVAELSQRGLSPFQMVIDKYNRLRQKEMEVK